MYAFARRAIVLSCVLWAAFGPRGGEHARGETIINPGTTDWVAAARTSRVDLLIIGDSVTTAWQIGMTAKAHELFGLAGTGLLVPASSSYEGYGTFVGDTTWSTAPGLVPPERQSFIWGNAQSAGAAVCTQLGIAIDPASGSPTLPMGAAYDFHLWTASPPGGGSMTVGRYLVEPTQWITVPPSPLGPVTTQTPTQGLQEHVFAFPALTPGAADNAVQDRFAHWGTTQTSVMYDKLVRPNATGVAVTAWRYGGRSALEFLNEQYLSMSPEGRQQWLSAIVADDSGKLNVVIAEGFNDSGRETPSAHNVGPSNTPAGFADNVATLIAALRADWAAGGHGPADLSFTLLGMYDVAESNDLLCGFAGALAQMAAGDPQISFVDVRSMTPDYQSARDLGYLDDAVHLSRNGGLLYGGLAMQSLVPEPASLGLLLGAGVLLIRRRR